MTDDRGGQQVWELRFQTALINGGRNADFGEKQNDYRMEAAGGVLFLGAKGHILSQPRRNEYSRMTPARKAAPMFHMAKAATMSIT